MYFRPTKNVCDTFHPFVFFILHKYTLPYKEQALLERVGEEEEGHDLVVDEEVHHELVVMEGEHHDLVVVEELHHDLVVVERLHHDSVVKEELHHDLVVGQEEHHDLVVGQEEHHDPVVGQEEELHHDLVVKRRRRSRGGRGSRLRRLLAFQLEKERTGSPTSHLLLSLRGTDHRSNKLWSRREQALAASPLLGRRGESREGGVREVEEGEGEGKGEEGEEAGSHPQESMFATIKKPLRLFSTVAISPSTPTPSTSSPTSPPPKEFPQQFGFLPSSTPSPSPSPSPPSPTTTFPQQMGCLPFPTFSPSHPHSPPFSPPHPRNPPPGLPAPVLHWMCWSCGSPIPA